MPNDVTMPGGARCAGGRCEKVRKILSAKVNTKKRYNVGSAKAKPGSPPVPPVKTKAAPEKMLLSVKNTVAGEGTTTDYDADDTQSARSDANKKYAGSAKKTY